MEEYNQLKEQTRFALRARGDDAIDFGDGVFSTIKYMTKKTMRCYEFNQDVYFSLKDVSGKEGIIQGTKTIREIDIIIEDVLRRGSLTSACVIKMHSRVVPEAYKGTYIHAFIAQLYLQKHDTEAAEATALFTVRQMLHHSDDLREEARRAAEGVVCTIRASKEIHEKHLHSLHVQIVDDICAIMSSQFSTFLSAANSGNVPSAFILNDDVFFACLDVALSNLNMYEVDDVNVKLIVYMRFELMKILCPERVGAAQLFSLPVISHQALRAHLDVDMKRIDDGVLPSYVHEYLQQSEDVRYVGKCKKRVVDKLDGQVLIVDRRCKGQWELRATETLDDLPREQQRQQQKVIKATQDTVSGKHCVVEKDGTRHDAAQAQQQEQKPIATVLRVSGGRGGCMKAHLPLLDAPTQEELAFAAQCKPQTYQEVFEGWVQGVTSAEQAFEKRRELFVRLIWLMLQKDELKTITLANARTICQRYVTDALKELFGAEHFATPFFKFEASMFPLSNWVAKANNKKTE